MSNHYAECIKLNTNGQDHHRILFEQLLPCNEPNVVWHDTTSLFFTVCTPIRLTSDLILHDINLSRIAGLKLQAIVPIDLTNFSSKLHCVNFE